MSPRSSLAPLAGLVPATSPSQRPADARLLAIDATGAMEVGPRGRWTDLVRPDDLVVANDAATLPASLRATHLRTRQPVEIRLAGRGSLDPRDLVFDAVLFGAGDHRTRTEDRALPPSVEPGDELDVAGDLVARVLAVLGHPRFVRISLATSRARSVWAALARHGRPVQYAHVPEPLALWDSWTAIAGPPVAFEPPSAGFVLDWSGLDALRARGAAFATLTHAAGLSSTGDPSLDARLPLDEAYRIPARTAQLVTEARARGGRVIAIGTTVVRALEHAARDGRPLPGEGVADQRLGAGSILRATDVIVSGTHEPGTSHRELLRAFATDAVLTRADAFLAKERFRTHEFGDSVWIEARHPIGSPRKRLPGMPQPLAPLEVRPMNVAKSMSKPRKRPSNT